MTFATFSLVLAVAGGLSALPIGIASGDFDGDGMVDLVCGFSGAEGDYLVLYPGNVDSLFPHSPEARRHHVARGDSQRQRR